MKALLDDCRYLFYTIFHPFDGFYELRFRRRKNWVLIISLLVLYGLVEIFRQWYTGIIMRTWDTYGLNGLLTFASALFPLILFALSNWSVTTLTEGNGRLSDIVMVTAYATVPKMVTGVLVTVASNFIIQEETIILTVIDLFGTVMFCFLIFAGLCVIHEYTAWKTVLTVFYSAIAAMIIFFILLFFFSIVGKMIGLVSVIFTELTN
ncbi:MAG: YIP1 family protein [Clostridia bacterium]|nr:YIP1 family protein [Clostridia bacterium]